MEEKSDRGVIMDIAERINYINNHIAIAAKVSGRNGNDIKLIAVSKTQPVEILKDAYENGVRDFGENKVQELLSKYPLEEDINWHLIGHLQKNKVKYIIDKVKLIHSLDSIELAEEINKRAGQINKVMPLLIQINIGREETKSGIFEEELENFCERLASYENIIVKGLMAIPPATEKSEESRKYFKKMKFLFDKVKAYNFKNFNIKYLSMGMTNDYEIAIEEGANIVRVGTGIFGQRKYKRGEEDVK